MPTAHLTEIYQPEVERGKWNTLPGMAHWAGSGPRGQTCRGCEFWTGGKERYASAKTGEHAQHELKPGQCAKHKQLKGRLQGRIPHRTPACKYFNADDNPPDIAKAPKYG